MVIDESLEKTVNFLLKERNKTGWWKDFETLAGYSDEWVTAYVASALAQSQLPEAKAAAQKAWRLLEKRRFWSKGWGYNKKVPKDTDSTTWALHLAEKTGNEDGRRATRSYKFLFNSINKEGGISTYPNDSPIRFFTGLKRKYSFAGWCSPHPSVSAAASSLKYFKNCNRIIAYLRNLQNDNGSWTGYWWCDKEYTTLLSINALTQFAAMEDIERINKAVEWVMNRITTGGHIPTEDHLNGSPFATALALQILLGSTNPHDEKTKSMTELLLTWIIKNQEDSGSWTSSARLRVPPPNEMHPERRKNWNRSTLGGGSIRLDQNSLFTASTVLNSLNRYKEIHY